MNKNLFFGDPVLKKYYEQDELKKFRNRVNRMYSKESFEKMAYVVVTDSIRDIIYEVISELTVFLKPMGDIILVVVKHSMYIWTVTIRSLQVI